MSRTANAAAVVAESLEDRRLYSATVEQRKNRLVITGDDNPTSIVVSTSPDRKQVQVTIDGVLVDPNPNGGPTTGVKRSKVHKVLITTGAGNDTIVVGLLEDVPHRGQEKRLLAKAIVYGGPGDDTIQGGPQGDVLIGGAGNDTIIGGDNNDLLFGGTGDDHLSGTFRRDILFGQDGNDTIEGDSGNDALYGMNGDDTLTGGPDADFLNGGTGNDAVLDGNNDPFLGVRKDAQQYMERIVHLSVPKRFRPYVSE